ncbi:MAG: DUF6077 domain-containing protein [Myxococcota bacterium]|nr:DUF6077 domain-containing protein [Myxococcota bacterium]
MWLALEVAIEGLAAWTLAVHSCMAIGAPAALAWLIFAVFLGGFQYAGRSRWRVARGAGREDAYQALTAVALGLLFSIPALVLLTPSGDDFNFFHRAIWQLSHLGEPFTAADTAFSAPGLQAISPLHTLTTWELGMAMSAKALGLDPLGVYHNGSIILTTVLLACLFVLWLRELGYGPAAAVGGAFGVFLFFFVDDPAVRSYAIAWRMLWVGKMVQWLLLFPLALLFAWRYLRDESRKPDWRLLLHPLCCGVAAVGLSGTGVFLLPGVFAAASLAAFAAGPHSGERLLRCGVLNLASLYCVAIAALLFSGVLPQPSDMRAWTDSFPSNWLDSLFLVFGHDVGLFRSAFLAFVVPAVMLRGSERRFLCLYGLALVLIFTNPVSGPLWIEAAQPGSYWRVALLFPVSLGVAIALASLVDSMDRRSPKRVVALGVVFSSLALIVASRTIEPQARALMRHEYSMKSPLALRLQPEQASFLEPVRHELVGRRLLGAPGIVTTAALLVPSLRIDAARLKDTRHVFANAGRSEEGEKRIAAWQWAGLCVPHPPGARAAAALFAEGTNALIVRDCPRGARIDAERARVLSASGKRWSEVARSHGFVLYLSD